LLRVRKASETRAHYASPTRDARGGAMERSEISKLLLSAKRAKGLGWGDLSKQLGMGEVWLASLFYGEASATAEIATAIVKLLDLPEEVARGLMEYPLKGNSLEARTIPTDPLLYRFYEILACYGLPLKDVIQEKFGDGIMSAIDFTMDVQKQVDSKGDRVIVTMSGKFLPYKRW
jgi:cyanate lyase